MQVAVDDVRPLRFDDGAPVRAASAIVPFGDGWLVAQDDATHAAWVRRGSVARVRVLPPVAGLDTFEEATGTKHLKPDLESGFAVPGRPGSVVLLGSGSAAARMRGVCVRDQPAGPAAATADLSSLYARAADAMRVSLEFLNLEGACVLDGTLRWFQRGVPSAGVPTGSVDVDLDGLLAVLDGALPAAEDTDDPREDGPVIGSVLAVVVDGAVVRSAPLPAIAGTVPKIEGLAVVDDRSRDTTAPGVRVLATVDSDDATAPSLAVGLRVSW